MTEGTIDYLSKQVEAGAEVVKLFDSWAGSLKGEDFDRYALAPAQRIIAELKARHPGLPIIAFPREAGDGLHRVRQGDRGRLRGARQFGDAGAGRRSMSRRTAACRATSRPGTW